MSDARLAGATIAPGVNGMPKAMLTAADGARAEIYLHGAHVTSWRPAGAGECLFLSGTSEFKAGTAIRGGVPVVFPQFSLEGPLPRHGFARVQPWEFAGSTVDAAGAASAVFELADSAPTRALWPHAFTARFTVRAGGAQLGMTLSILNTGSSAFSFTAALHTYLRIEDLARTRVHGLHGLRYRDTAADRLMRDETATELAFAGEVDRVYFDAPANLDVTEPGRTMRVTAAGFPDVVIWNPGAARGATIVDLEPGGYGRMLCVEAAAIGTPVTLPPGAQWRASQTLAAS